MEPKTFAVCTSILLDMWPVWFVLFIMLPLSFSYIKRGHTQAYAHIPKLSIIPYRDSTQTHMYT